ncbi:MAG: right-handed parallel beta-helix repeat-containing protein [Gammaproteobacteria bacterium]|nr:right-handed parallel beta-helix repeat-containing protein [Gammaproteobacteria bacterium]
MRSMGIVAATVLAASGSVASAGPLPQTNTFTVDCDRHETISGAIARGDVHKPLVVNIRGTCNEFVAIRRDDVTLHGDPAATVNAPNLDSDLVTIEANGITLENLTLTGGSYGVRQNHGFRFMITNCVIQNTRSDGIRIFVGDTRFVDSTVQGAGANGVYLTRGGSFGASNSRFLDNASSGISAYLNSTVSASGSTISGNGGNGIDLGAGSQGAVSASTISGNGADPARFGNGLSGWGGSSAHVGASNVITGNREAGILIAGGSTAYVFDNTITGNGGNGVTGYFAATLVIDNGNISSNNGHGVDCSANCSAQIVGATIQGNAGSGINLAFDSALMLQAPMTSAGGNGGSGLWCFDKESSVNGLEWFSGTVGLTCTDFDH